MHLPRQTQVARAGHGHLRPADRRQRVLARFLIPTPNEVTRFSLEAVPIFLAGMLFGPLPGALTGFAADFIGCLFSPYGYNPIFCVPRSCTACAPGFSVPG